MTDDEEKTVAAPPTTMTEVPAAPPVTRLEVDDEATKVNPPKAAPAVDDEATRVNAGKDDEATKVVPNRPPVTALPRPADRPRPPRKPMPAIVLGLVLSALALMLVRMWLDHRPAERPEDAKPMRPAEEDKRGPIEKFFDG